MTAFLLVIRRENVAIKTMASKSIHWTDKSNQNVFGSLFALYLKMKTYSNPRYLFYFSPNPPCHYCYISHACCLEIKFFFNVAKYEISLLKC